MAGFSFGFLRVLVLLDQPNEQQPVLLDPELIGSGVALSAPTTHTLAPSPTVLPDFGQVDMSCLDLGHCGLWRLPVHIEAEGHQEVSILFGPLPAVLP